jgi:hypothetical protein
MNKKTDKAYNNKDFLNGKAARPVRVLCELIEPEERLEENNIENTIVFFWISTTERNRDGKS